MNGFEIGVIVHEDNHAHVVIAVDDPDTGSVVRLDVGCPPSVMALAGALVQAAQICRELNQTLEEASEEDAPDIIRQYQARASAHLN